LQYLIDLRTLEARNGTRTKVVTTRSESYKGEGTGEPYERVEVVDDRITRVAERGGEVPGGPAERDGGGEHRPEREERDDGERPRLVPPLPKQRRIAGRERDGDLGGRRRGVEAVVVVADGLHGRCGGQLGTGSDSELEIEGEVVCLVSVWFGLCKMQIYKAEPNRPHAYMQIQIWMLPVKCMLTGHMHLGYVNPDLDATCKIYAANKCCNIQRVI
jgi:hypothetical protein